jgi:hypothetical protein
MLFFAALLIFLGIAAVAWAVALALYQTWVGCPDLRQKRDFGGIAALDVGLVDGASPIPFRGG